MVSALRLVAAAAAFASSAYAAHTITFHNACGWAVGQTVSNYPGGGGFNGPFQLSIPAGGRQSITVNDGWNGRICDKPPNSGCENDCWGGIAFGKASCSMTEFKMNGDRNLNYYNISNIQGYSVALMIQPVGSGCENLICQGVNCPCKQAYRPGDISGTCGGTGALDQAVRACGNRDFNVIFCP